MYNYLRESYNTTKDYLKTKNPKGVSVLKQESAENNKEYESRLDRTPIRNHIGLIVDRYHSSVTKNEVERDINWKDFYKNYESIFLEALKESQIVGKCYIVSSLNNAERMSEIDLQLFLVPVDTVYEYIPNQVFAFEDIVDEKEYTIIYDNTGSWKKFNSSNELVESGESGFNKLPVIEMTPEFPCVSQVALLAPIQESLVNLLSLHMEESLQSTFTRHLISGLSEIPSTYEEEQKVQRMISGKKLLLFKDSVNVTSLAADASQAQNLLAAIKQTEDMLYAVAGLRLSEPIRESGLAKALEMEQFADIRNKLVKALENAENAFMELLMSQFGVEWGQTSYSYETMKQTWTERITEIKELLSLGLSEEFLTKIKQRFESDYLLDNE